MAPAESVGITNTAASVPRIGIDYDELHSDRWFPEIHRSGYARNQSLASIFAERHVVDL